MSELSKGRTLRMKIARHDSSLKSRSGSVRLQTEFGLNPRKATYKGVFLNKEHDDRH